ncbi:uncharacterized protein LOC124256262 [Haliotis rubra]|uniref:uncharacterized protein LOC124256262 n=1 Tax=Haliotis rubra TaxID=36100 RepID=UPI001EE50CC1|nr:uncharacterized protein LOC124256262 [Haliotis rubra]
MARYQAMERVLQDRPSKSSALEISTELKQIQGAVAQLNEQHKTERGRLSVRVGVKGLSKSSKKQLKKELQELGDRQKHLLQVVHRHKQLNFRLKQVLAGIDATGTSCSGGESSKDKHGNVNTFPPSRPAAEASTVHADITDGNGRRPFIEKPSSVPTIYKTDIVDRFHDITAAENGGSALFESSFRKDNASKVFQRDQNGVSRTYGAIEARTSNVTGYHDRKKECLDNDVDVLSQYYRDDMEQTQKTDFSDSILISKSNPTCIVDNSVITATNNELLAKADLCPAPCSQIKETEAFVKSVHSSGAVDRTASQISEIEDSQQDLFSQGSSELEGDRRMVEEIIATQALSHESDCPDHDIRHIGGRVRQGKKEWVWTEGGTDQKGLKKVAIEMEEDAMDRGVEGRMDSEVEGRMGSEVEGLVVRRVDGSMGSEVDGQMDSRVEGRIDGEVEERMDSGRGGRRNRGVEGRMDTQADRKTDRHADRTDSEVDERIGAQTDRRMDRRVSGRINTQNDGRVAIHIDDNTAWQGGVSVNMQEDDKLDKKKGADLSEMNWNSATSSGPVSQMKRKAEDSSAPSFEGRSECETKKIKTCTAEQFVKSVEGGQAPCKPGISQSESDATKSEVKERETYHQKAGNRNSEGESIQSKIASDKKEGFVLSVKQTCSKEVDGSLVPISLKSKDGSLNKSRDIIPEYRNINNDNTTGQVNGPSLSSHGNSGTLSSAVGAEGSTPNLMSPSNVRSVCSARMEVTCLSLPEQGTKKVKNVSLMSPPPRPLKNIATPPQKLQSENLPASTFLSPGSTVASSDVFPVSCRELVRRMAERDAREKQSRKDKVLLQEEAPSNYIAIPIGRIEDFSENLQVKDVDDDTQTPMFVQPQVPSAPKPVATSKMADLPTLVEKGVLTPGKDVLSVRAEGKVFRATLSRKGHIIGSEGEMFRTPTSWCQAVSGAGTVNKLQSYNMVLYKGRPLSSFVVRESTESSGQKDVRAQTKSQGKLVSSSITRSLKTVNKSTSLPRQSLAFLQQPLQPTRFEPSHSLTQLQSLFPKEQEQLPQRLPPGKLASLFQFHQIGTLLPLEIWLLRVTRTPVHLGHLS